MKTKVFIVILLVASIGLAVTLMVTRKQSEQTHKSDAATIESFSNQLVNVNASLQDQRQVNLELTNRLAASQQETLTLSNDLADTKGSLQREQDKVAGLNNQVADLESRNQEMDQNLITLSNTIGSLSAQIAEAQAQLASSETNNAFLTAELQKQLAQRSDLEKKFNDLKELRMQVKKIKTEQFVARRLDWERQGIDPSQQVKGAQLLMQHDNTTVAATRQPHYDLNVEVSSDGAVRIVPATNAPPAQQ
ncbi:MAG TPA: hypothetical protein VFV23_10645 [Verrucomicrobiae bacterium]|nr:hypothetical protein [Verrucomicrobiae bacterium]